MAMQGRLTGREQRVASREQMLTRQDAESACQVAEARAAAASAYRNARRDLDQEYKAHREALDRERRALEADRYCAAIVPFAAAGFNIVLYLNSPPTIGGLRISVGKSSNQSIAGAAAAVRSGIVCCMITRVAAQLLSMHARCSKTDAKQCHLQACLLST